MGALRRLEEYFTPEASAEFLVTGAFMLGTDPISSVVKYYESKGMDAEDAIEVVSLIARMILNRRR